MCLLSTLNSPKDFTDRKRFKNSTARSAVSSCHKKTKDSEAGNKDALQKLKELRNKEAYVKGLKGITQYINLGTI